MNLISKAYPALFKVICKTSQALGGALRWLQSAQSAIKSLQPAPRDAGRGRSASHTKIMGAVRLRGCRLNLDISVEHRAESFVGRDSIPTRLQKRGQRADNGRPE